MFLNGISPPRNERVALALQLCGVLLGCRSSTHCGYFPAFRGNTSAAFFRTGDGSVNSALLRADGARQGVQVHVVYHGTSKAATDYHSTVTNTVHESLSHLLFTGAKSINITTSGAVSIGRWGHPPQCIRKHDSADTTGCSSTVEGGDLLAT